MVRRWRADGRPGRAVTNAAVVREPADVPDPRVGLCDDRTRPVRIVVSRSAPRRTGQP